MSSWIRTNPSCAWSFSLALFGCGGASLPIPPSSPRAAATVGHDTAVGEAPCAIRCVIGPGVEPFRTLEPDEPLQLVHGLQGGWHIDVRVAVEGLGGSVRATHSIDGPHGRISELVAPGAVRTLADEGTCLQPSPIYRAYLDQQLLTLDEVCALEGQSLELQITATGAGVTACSHRGPARLDPADVALCQARSAR